MIPANTSPPADALHLLEALEQYAEVREESRPPLRELCSLKSFYPEEKFSGSDLDLWAVAVGNFFEQWIAGRLQVWARRGNSLNWLQIPSEIAIHVDLNDIVWFPGSLCLPGGERVYVIKVAEAAGMSETETRPSPKKRGPKPELRGAMRKVFCEWSANADQLAQVKGMSQESRAIAVGKVLGLPDDERPSRSYVQRVWEEWLSELELRQIPAT